MYSYFTIEIPPKTLIPSLRYHTKKEKRKTTEGEPPPAVKKSNSYLPLRSFQFRKSVSRKPRWALRQSSRTTWMSAAPAAMRQHAMKQMQATASEEEKRRLPGIFGRQETPNDYGNHHKHHPEMCQAPPDPLKQEAGTHYDSKQKSLYHETSPQSEYMFRYCDCIIHLNTNYVNT